MSLGHICSLCLVVPVAAEGQFCPECTLDARAELAAMRCKIFLSEPVGVLPASEHAKNPDLIREKLKWDRVFGSLATGYGLSFITGANAGLLAASIALGGCSVVALVGMVGGALALIGHFKLRKMKG